MSVSVKLLRRNDKIKTDEEHALEQCPDHSKIISELFKKYPDLVQENKCIKLKIVQKVPPMRKCNEAPAKISYVVLKSNSSSDPLGSPLIAKRAGRMKGESIAKSTFWNHPEKCEKISYTQNLQGPWICKNCDAPTANHTDDDAPIKTLDAQFNSYHSYHRHLVVRLAIIGNGRWSVGHCQSAAERTRTFIHISFKAY